MGLDAMIYFRSSKEQPELDWGLLEKNSIQKTEPDGFSPEGATHRVKIDGNNRFYGLHYERGVWPRLAAILMELFASPDVETVWYGNDCQDGLDPITREEVLDLTRHYMQVGTRPYYGKRKVTP